MKTKTKMMTKPVTYQLVSLVLLSTFYVTLSEPDQFCPLSPSSCDDPQTAPSRELLMAVDKNIPSAKPATAPPPPPPPLKFEIRSYTQTIDHFTFLPQSYQTFQQRYAINSEFWAGTTQKEPGPIFVYAGGEGDIEWETNHTGLIHEIAPRFKALLVFIEHRYYGKSIPFNGDKKIAYSNATTFGYLTTAQALADFATIILDLKKNLSAVDSPVVIFGGSYAGALAAWFRLKYPHVVIGALASSAPVLNSQTAPHAYNNVISQDFRNESENCYNVIKQSWQVIEDTWKKPGGRDQVLDSLHMCKLKEIEQSILVTYWVRNAFLYTAMSDGPIPSSSMNNPLPAYPVKEMCKAIDDPNLQNDTLAKIYRAVNVFYNYTGNVKDCFNMLDFLMKDVIDAEAWHWQTITEHLAYRGSYNESIFPPSVEENYTSMAAECKSEYGIEPRPNWIFTEFGGYNMNRYLRRFGSNIIFFNGLRDPVSSKGVLTNISETIVAIVAEQGSHTSDLGYSTREDPPWLRDIRDKEISIIQKWLSEYYQDLAMFPSNIKV